MSVSAIFGSRVVIAPDSSAALSFGSGGARLIPRTEGGLVIECSSRPKKKATAHHMKTRPRKRQPWDIKRKPTVYPPLPPLPPDWTLVISADDSPAVAAPSPPPPPPLTPPPAPSP